MKNSNTALGVVSFRIKHVLQLRATQVTDKYIEKRFERKEDDTHISTF